MAVGAAARPGGGPGTGPAPCTAGRSGAEPRPQRGGAERPRGPARPRAAPQRLRHRGGSGAASQPCPERPAPPPPLPDPRSPRHRSRFRSPVTPRPRRGCSPGHGPLSAHAPQQLPAPAVAICTPVTPAPPPRHGRLHACPGPWAPVPQRWCHDCSPTGADIRAGAPVQSHSSSALGCSDLQAAPPRVSGDTGMGSAPAPGKAALWACLMKQWKK